MPTASRRSSPRASRKAAHVISAAIMAGGKSRRMGQDKAWIELEGRPIAARVVDVLREVADEVLIVANDPRFAELGLRVVPDRFPEGGALGGIATGVGAATHDRVLVAACDMPFLRADVWRLVVQRSDGADAVVPKVGGEYETLHALYTKACLGPLERALGAGKMRVISFFPEVRVREIPEADLRALDPDLRSLTNVNTPEELAAATAPRSRRSGALAAGIAEAGARVLARVTELAPVAWRSGAAADGWTVGFETWHIARGLERQRGWIERSLRGDLPFPFDLDATNALNAESSARFGDPPQPDTVALLRRELDRTVALVSSLGEADLERDCVETDGKRASVRIVAGRVMVRHIAGHLDAIENALTG